MRYLTADIVFSIFGQPLSGAVLVVGDNGIVQDLLPAAQADYTLPDLETFRGFLCPGFVNTHCHLELSAYKGLIEPGTGLDHFLKNLELLRPDMHADAIEKALDSEAGILFHSGTVAVGDISNTTATIPCKSKSPISFYTFAEVFGSDPSRAQLAFNKMTSIADRFQSLDRNNWVSVVPHATYSLSDALFRLVARNAEAHNSLLSMHHQESEDENQFFTEGKGKIAERRKLFNPGIPDLKATGRRPLESIASFFSNQQAFLLVHNTVSREEDLDFAEATFQNICWCLCPNANLYIENKMPDIPLFRKKGSRISLGTDSLASNRSLSLLEEMKTVSFRYPEIPICEILSWGTRNGAEILGFSQLGTFEKGKTPGVVLIENADIRNECLTSESSSRLIIPPGI